MPYRLLTAFFILFLINGSYAQYNSEGDLISRFRPGGMWYFTGFRPAVPEKVRKYDRLIFDLTYNDWAGDLDPLKNQWRSLGLNTNLMFDIPISKGNTVSFGTGLSHAFFRINSNGYRFAADAAHTHTHLYTLNETETAAANRFLGGNSIAVPIEMRFRTKGWKHFKVHIGGKIGYQWDLYTRTIEEGQSGILITKNKNLPDATRLIYSAHVRIGIRNWALFGSYNISTLFQDHHSPQLNLLQGGLSLSLF
jgi:hypothetical protein